MKKKLLILLPVALITIALASCSRLKQETITNVVTVEGEEVEVMRIKNSISDVYKEASKSCVGIYASNTTSASVGSGVIYKKDGPYYYVVTNHHVINQKIKTILYRNYY